MSGKQGFIQIDRKAGEQDSGVEPDFPMVNNRREKLDPSYRLCVSGTPATLYCRKRRGSKCPLVQVKSENNLDNKETPKKVNVAITDLSVFTEVMKTCYLYSAR